MQQLYTIIFVVITFVSICGQNYSTIFKKDLPGNILTYYSSDVINEIFKRDAELCPDLLFWRIHYINEMIGKKNTDNKTNGYNYLIKLTNDYYNIRKDFFNNQILYTETEIHNEHTGRIKDDLLSAFQNPELVKFREYNEPEADTNKINYIVVKYYTKNSNMVYDSLKDFSVMRTASEREILKSLKSEYAELDNNVSELPQDQANIFLNNWFTFYNNPNSIDNLPTVLNKYYERKYTIKGIKQFTALMGLSFIYSNEMNSFDIKVPNYNPIPVKSNLKSYLNLSFEFDYKYLIGKTISPFSYINLGIMGRYGSIPSAPVNDLKFYQRFNEYDANNFTSIYLNATNVSIETPSYIGLYFKATAPFLVITPDFILEVGAVMGVNITKTQIDYDCNYSMVKISYSGNGYQHTNLGSLIGRVSDSQKKNSYYITPLIDINYKIVNPVLIKLSGGYNYISLRAGLEF